MTKQIDDRKMSAYNSTYNKLAVQWLIKTLRFVSKSVVGASLRLRNRQLLVAANRQEAKNPLLKNLAA